MDQRCRLAHRTGRYVLLALIVALLAACGAQPSSSQGPALETHAGATVSATAAPSATSVPTATPPANCPNKLLATATVPPAPAPTPIAAANWMTYTNTAAHYTIQYPASWYVPDPSPTTTDFSLLNFNPTTYQPRGDDLPPPPYEKIELEVLPTSTQQSPLDFYHANTDNDPLAPPPCSRTVTPTTVAGHDALQIVQWPFATGNQPPITYPQVTYYVAGSGGILLGFTEYYSPGGQPSATFARMIASVSFTA